MKYNLEYYDQCFKAVNVNRDELEPTELIRYVSLAVTTAVLSGREIDTLIALCQDGPLAVGCEPSKAGRSDLVDKGLCVAVVVKGDMSYYGATYYGYEVYRMWMASHQEGAVKPVEETTQHQQKVSVPHKTPKQLLIQVSTCQIKYVKDKIYPMGTVVTSLEQLSGCKDAVVLLPGKETSWMCWGWVLESGEALKTFSGDYVVRQYVGVGYWLRRKDGSAGGEFDLIDWVTGALNAATQTPVPPEGVLGRRHAQLLSQATQTALEVSDEAKLLSKWGLVELVDNHYQITPLGMTCCDAIYPTAKPYK